MLEPGEVGADLREGGVGREQLLYPPGERVEQGEEVGGGPSRLHARANREGERPISVAPALPCGAVETLRHALGVLGIEMTSATALAGDASQRRFFRVHAPDGGSVVAALYQSGQEAQAERDHAVQRWGWARGLPIPRPIGRHGLVVVSEDLGELDLERAAAAAGEGVLPPVLAALAAFQRCGLDGLVTPKFDAALFRAELAVFERHVTCAAAGGTPAVTAFLDDLARRLASHPYRLTHRDFHLNNLFLQGGVVRAVDFQDMRGGPDTYDLASLLRERGGAGLTADEPGWVARAAGVLEWEPGWRQRYLECAAQRGLKVVGTFLRLAAAGRPAYLAWLPAVGARASAALAELGAPARLVAIAAAPDRGL